MSAFEAFIGRVVAAAIIREVCALHVRSTAREALLVDALRSLQPLDTLS